MRFLHHQMLCIQVVCTIFMPAWSSVVAIDCFECTNATTIEECKSTVTCNTGEICFADYFPTGNQTLYSFGCRSKGTCKKETQSTNEGSDSLGGGSASCSQCCKEHHCNRQLCQDLFQESDCSDRKGIDCFTLEQFANICLDTTRAKSVCRRLCGLCSYEDGHWAAWSTWSVCDVTCGDGHQTRARTCTEPAPSGGGKVCQGSSGDTQICTLEPCPVHGNWTEWGPWGACSATCGIGMQRRGRSCSNPYPARLGDHCFGDSRDDQLCVLTVCPVTNGGWGAWTVWTQCSVSCNGGIQQRQRQCNNPKPSADGDYCGDSALDVQMCSIEKCPITNGGWGSWASWTRCSASCNGGMQSRERNCNKPYPSADGRYCNGKPSDVQLCNVQKCPITNGGWGWWTSWTSCTASCNGGMQSRERNCNKPYPSAEGRFCNGKPSDVQICNVQKCPRKKASFFAKSPSRLSTGTLQFSTVILNEGTVYDSSTGVFTCPFPGLYTFSTNIFEGGNGNNNINCIIRKSGTNLIYINSRQGTILHLYQASDGWSAASGTVTLHLVNGDHVDVYCSSSTGTSLGYSSFTGFLISEDP